MRIKMIKTGVPVSFTMSKYLIFREVQRALSVLSKRCFCDAQTSISKRDIFECENFEDEHLMDELPNIPTESVSLLKDTTEDLSYFQKFLSPTFNFAAYVNKSETLINMVNLGVNLHKLEKKYGVPEMILKMDFECDMKGHISFLNDYVDTRELGNFITKNPMIFRKSIDDLQTRINYLESKKFTHEMIKRIVTKNPYWLNFSTLNIDHRLGHFQNEFHLIGNEVRELATKQPRLITYSMYHLKVNTFAIREEMGFTEDQIKSLLLEKPHIWMMNQHTLLDKFLYLHRTMNISHEMMCAMPLVFMYKVYEIKQRHEFLAKLGRAQYNNTKPNYVSLIKLVEGTDADFCFNVAKCPVSDYNLYLKTL